MIDLILIAHNLRSSHNVGSLLRTAEGLGVRQVYLTGYTPYPQQPHDTRLPHLSARISRQIHKSALGAENFIKWQHTADLDKTIQDLKTQGYLIAALEQAPGSLSLPDFQPPTKLALIVGREVEGLEADVLATCDLILEIPMAGHKESFNVAQAAAIALYHCRLAS